MTWAGCLTKNVGFRLIQYPPPPCRGRITVTKEDLACLDAGEFLNDVIIDFYLKSVTLASVSSSRRQRLDSIQTALVWMSLYHFLCLRLLWITDFWSWKESAAPCPSRVTSSAVSSSSSWVDGELPGKTMPRLSRKSKDFRHICRQRLYFSTVQKNSAHNQVLIVKSGFNSEFEKETFNNRDEGIKCPGLVDSAWFHGDENVLRSNRDATLIPSDGSIVVFQWSSHEAPEGEDLDAPRGHFHQRFPVRACQSRVSGFVFKVWSWSDLVCRNWLDDFNGAGQPVKSLEPGVPPSFNGAGSELWPGSGY